MLYWLRFPFLRITPLALLGVWIAEKFTPPVLAILVCLGVFLIIYLLIYALYRKRFSLQYIQCFVALAAVFCVFALRGTVVRSDLDPYHFTKLSYSAFAGDVVRSQGETARNYRTVLQVVAVRDSSGWSRATGKVLLYTPKAQRIKLTPGTVVVITQEILSIPAPSNPGEFDYRSFLRRKGIEGQVFSREESWQTLRRPGKANLPAFLSSVRSKGQVIIDTGLDEEARGIASALLLGQREGISDAVQTSYRNAGGAHVLAISGLHVGIIYGALLFFFGRFRNSVLFGLLSILTLWAFACLSGLSPSVTRAALMFSLFSIGRLAHRKAHPLNTLALSAFVLVLINPMLVFDVGFQLSHLAVLGILVLFPVVSGLITGVPWVLQRIWDLTAVALAAQMFTFPLVIHYFKGVPVLSLLTNLVVVPGATVVLLIGLLFFAVSPLSPHHFSRVIANVLDGTVALMNDAVGWVGDLPFAYATSVYLSAYQTLLVTIALLVTVTFFLARNMWALRGAVMLWLLVGILPAFLAFQKRSETELVVYNVPNQAVIDVFAGGSRYSLHHELPIRKDADYHFVNHRRRMAPSGYAGILPTRVRIDSLILATVYGKRVAWITGVGDAANDLSRCGIHIHYLIVSRNALDLGKGMDGISAEMVILDRTNDYFYAERATRILRELDWQVHNVRSEGAFQSKLN